MPRGAGDRQLTGQHCGTAAIAVIARFPRSCAVRRRSTAPWRSHQPTAHRCGRSRSATGPGCHRLVPQPGRGTAWPPTGTTRCSRRGRPSAPGPYADHVLPIPVGPINTNSATLDGSPLATVGDSSYSHGMIALGREWDHAQFDWALRWRLRAVRYAGEDGSCGDLLACNSAAIGVLK